MSAILAVMDREGRTVDPDLLEALLRAGPCPEPDAVGSWRDGPIALGHRALWETPEDVGTSQPIADHADRLRLVFDGRLDNRAEIADDLKLSATELRRCCDAELVLLAYERWSHDTAARLLGEFAFIVWDRQARGIFAARDAMGMRRLSYVVHEHYCVVATAVAMIVAHPGVPTCPNGVRIAEYLVRRGCFQHESFYRDIWHVPPGHGLWIGMQEHALRRYWELDATKVIRYKRSEEYVEEFGELFREAVRCRIRSNGPVGVALSGGLDSTSLAATLAPMLRDGRQEQKHLISISQVFDVFTECDERSYIEPLVRHHNIQAHFVPCDEHWTLRDIDSWPCPVDHPGSDFMPRATHALYATARQQGCRVLLGGWFGDTLFGGGWYWAAQMIADGRWGDLGTLWWRHRTVVPVRHTFVDYGVRPLIPRCAKSAFRALRPRRAGGFEQYVSAELVDRAARPNGPMSTGSKESAGATRGVACRERYDALAHCEVIRNLAVAQTQAAECRLVLADPYADRRLVQWALSVPADVLARPPASKHVLRMAMRGVLDDAVRLRRGKTSFNAPVRWGLLEAERESVARLLSKPQIVGRGYVRPTCLANAGSVGEIADRIGLVNLWRCVALELWLQRHTGREAGSPSAAGDADP